MDLQGHRSAEGIVDGTVQQDTPVINETNTGITPFLDLVGPTDETAQISELQIKLAKQIARLFQVPIGTATEFCGTVLTMGSTARVRDLIQALVPLGVHAGWPYFGIRPPAALLGFVCNAKQQSLKAIDSGIPAMPVFAMPKSGSSFSSVVLQNALAVQTGVVSLGHLTAYRPWVEYLARYPMVLHDHMQPRPFNLSELARAGVGRVAIQVRDPRQLVISLARHSEDNGGKNMSAVPQVSRGYANWLRGWRREAAKLGIQVHIVRYEDMVADYSAFFSSILDFFGAPPVVYDNLPKALDRAKEQLSQSRLNYRKGRTDEWKETLTPEQIAQVESLSAVAFEGVYSF